MSMTLDQAAECIYELQGICENHRGQLADLRAEVDRQRAQLATLRESVLDFEAGRW